MKNLFFFTAIMLSIICAKAQVSVPEPEFIGQVVLLTSDSTAVLLPKEKSTMKSKSTHFGMIPIPGASLLDKTKVNTVFQGKESSVTTDSGTVRFIMRVEKPDLDPSSYLRIVKFQVKKNNREITTAETGLFQGIHLDLSSTDSYEVKKYKDSSLLITLRNVEPGQYGISFTLLMDALTFGVK